MPYCLRILLIYTSWHKIIIPSFLFWVILTPIKYFIKPKSFILNFLVKLFFRALILVLSLLMISILLIYITIRIPVDLLTYIHWLLVYALNPNCWSIKINSFCYSQSICFRPYRAFRSLHAYLNAFFKISSLISQSS